jgi:hypothetical protein
MAAIMKVVYNFELKFGQIAYSVMLFRVRVIISCKHLAKIQKREFTFMKVVYRTRKKTYSYLIFKLEWSYRIDTCGGDIRSSHVKQIMVTINWQHSLAKKNI